VRTGEMHSYHLSGVSVNPKNATIYGVRKPTAFSALFPNDSSPEYFLHDIMDDVLEGVIPVTVRLVLSNFYFAGLE